MLIPQTPLVQALDWGGKVNTTRIDVHFAPAGRFYDGLRSEGFNAYERGQFEIAFAMIEAVIDVTFNIVPTPGGSEFRLVLDLDEMNLDILGYFQPPGETNAGVGAFNGARWDRAPGGDLEVGGYGFVTIVHEMLHGLGLAHPHDFGGTSSVFPGVEDDDDLGRFALNQGVYTTMSYNTGLENGRTAGVLQAADNYGYEAGPMALDIAVLQSKYGANTTTSAADTVYVLPQINAVGTAWRTIWDAGGYDEIQGGTGADTIDLRAATLQVEAGGGGFISKSAGISGGYTIAHGAVIEAARGAAGNDRLIGNQADNLLFGGHGDDMLWGGGAADLLIGGQGADVLQGQRGNDTYVISGPADVVIEGANRGIDTVQAFVDYTLGAHVERGVLGVITGQKDLNLNGNGAANFLQGNAGDNQIKGYRGADVIWAHKGDDVIAGHRGWDQIFAGGGDDLITGGSGADRLTGGFGGDTFIYRQALDSSVGLGTQDTIVDFESGIDRIDLSAMQATFTVIFDAEFSGAAGELRLHMLPVSQRTALSADIDGDAAADFQIWFEGRPDITEDDLIF